MAMPWLPMNIGVLMAMLGRPVDPGAGAPALVVVVVVGGMIGIGESEGRCLISFFNR